MTDQTNPAREYTIDMLVQCAAEVDVAISVYYWTHPDQVEAARRRLDSVGEAARALPDAKALVCAYAPGGYTFNNDSRCALAAWDYTQTGSLSAAIETVMRVVADGLIPIAPARPAKRSTRRK